MGDGEEASVWPFSQRASLAATVEEWRERERETKERKKDKRERESEKEIGRACDPFCVLKFESVYQRLTSARGVRNLAMRLKDIKIAAVKLPRPLGGMGDDDNACFDDFQQ